MKYVDVVVMQYPMDNIEEFLYEVMTSLGYFSITHDKRQYFYDIPKKKFLKYKLKHTTKELITVLKKYSISFDSISRTNPTLVKIAKKYNVETKKIKKGSKYIMKRNFGIDAIVTEDDIDWYVA